MARGFAVVGTDTAVGKSRVVAGLLAGCKALGVRAAGMKPVATGCRPTPAGLRNADAELLQRHAGVATDYDDVNPYAFGPPIAPQVAAARAGVTISPTRIADCYLRLCAQVEVVVVEGVGGWRVPLGPDCCWADLVRALQLPVVLVVGIRLGCINHALLSADAVASDGCKLIGWIANRATPDVGDTPDNIESIRERIDAPLLAELPFAAVAAAGELPGYLDISRLLRLLGPAGAN